jgi:peptidoglycan-associated lipoprotein
MLAEARAALTAPVYFEYDAAEITSEARALLDAKLPLLSANPSVRIRIAGHTDSRGSDEYNLALGQRRASATKAYLTQRGIDASRIDIVSFGEERPAAEGEDESAWSRNRRAEFEVVGGGESMTLPSS